jgi:hypothetical protein
LQEHQRGLSGRRCPDVINDDPGRVADSFVLPDEALDDVVEPLRDLVPR